MAALSKNKWYQWYIRDVSAGHMELPAYEDDEDGSIYIYYGEVFCRVADCSKGDHNYKSTNNLRTHIATHKDISMSVGNLGGRASQEVIDEAAKWYKQLFAGGEGEAHTGTGGGGGGTALAPAVPSLPLLPRKKDGKVHVTNMRAEVIQMGHRVPCSSCGARVNCCKNINRCDHFVLFDCGDLHPDVATQDHPNVVTEEANQGAEEAVEGAKEVVEEATAT